MMSETLGCFPIPEEPPEGIPARSDYEVEPDWPLGVDITKGSTRPPVAEYVESIIAAAEKEERAVGLVMYALELCGKVRPIEELLLKNASDEQIELEQEKRRFFDTEARAAFDKCDAMSYTQLQGELKALTPKDTAHPDLKTTPSIIKVLDTMYNKNMIGGEMRRKAEGVIRILILIQRGRREDIPVPQVEDDLRHQFSPEERQMMEDDSV